MQHGEDQSLVGSRFVFTHIDGVGPPVQIGLVGTVVGDGPGHMYLASAVHRLRRLDVGHLQIGRGRIEYDQGLGSRLEIIVVHCVGVIGIDIHIKGEFEDLVPGVAVHHNLEDPLNMNGHGPGDGSPHSTHPLRGRPCGSPIRSGSLPSPRRRLIRRQPEENRSTWPGRSLPAPLLVTR